MIEKIIAMLNSADQEVFSLVSSIIEDNSMLKSCFEDAMGDNVGLEASEFYNRLREVYKQKTNGAEDTGLLEISGPGAL